MNPVSLILIPVCLIGLAYLGFWRAALVIAVVILFNSGLNLL